MPRPELHSCSSHFQEPSHPHTFSCRSTNLSFFVSGGLFLDPALQSSFVNSIWPKNSSTQDSGSGSGSGSASFCHQEPAFFGVLRWRKNPRIAHCGFLSVSLRGDSFVREQKVHVDGYENCKKAGKCEGAIATLENDKREKHTIRKRGAMNTTKHLWSGAIAAMVSRCVFACSSI